FLASQLQSIGKSITTAEAPIKEKYARKILLGTHKEGGAVTFWSHVVSLPLASNAILSWKFCHMVHKLLRDGHPNVNSRGHVPSIKQMGILWGSLHDRYGHIVALYAKFLCIKIDFHCKHKEIPANLETPDEVLERTIAVDINKVISLYCCACDVVFRQLETNSTSSTTSVGQCRLAPLVLVIQDCSPLYHYLVKLLFKLHSRIPVDALLGHRERFRNQFDNLTQFFEKARGMEFFKTIIQIPDLPDSPPNFLRAASLADHVKPVVVRNQELPDDDDTETQLDFGEAPGSQMTEVDSLRRELEAVKPELQMFKAEAQRAVVQLKEQVNMLEAELEEQRTHKQMALVENEHLRMEVEALRTQSAVAASLQASADDGSFLLSCVTLWFVFQNADMVKQLSSTQQAQEELFKTKEQMAQELEQLRQEKYTKVELPYNLDCVCVQSSRESMLQQKLQEEQFCLLQCAVVEAEGIILDAVAKVDDPMHVRCVSTPEYLINRAKTTLVSIDKMQQSHAGYLRNMDDASGLLRAVTQFSHLAADTIVNGAATAHAVPTDEADRENTEAYTSMKHKYIYITNINHKIWHKYNTVENVINQDLQHKDADIQKAELADLVDTEMAATSTAIEEAVLKMDEILSQARRDTSGVKLEVNQSIIGSCSDLMKAIHMLVTAATDLQKDIVESGRGAGSVKDFYAKNSCWTEGLISASKTVGWTATQMVESADKVVTDRGKYEELIVCSHEIAASTAQLVAASKVKADRSNKKLHTLQHASRHVNDMAAVVVTSTKAGQMQIEDKNPMDFSGISLIKLKTEEMESQVNSVKVSIDHNLGLFQ
uniref:I/LWEQ domain-containing protein n=1 Tax=Pygocentrus nattereri TaxID=42514 RepID=A0AAR2L0J8_PYGNA